MMVPLWLLLVVVGAEVVAYAVDAWILKRTLRRHQAAMTEARKIVVTLTAAHIQANARLEEVIKERDTLKVELDKLYECDHDSDQWTPDKTDG